MKELRQIALPRRIADQSRCLIKYSRQMNIIKNERMCVCVRFRKNMYAGGDSQMNGDMPHDGGPGEGGHAVGEELQKTGRYVIMTALNNVCMDM